MALPDRLGRLRRVDRVGAGGFATVWLYHDDELDSPVAVKALADNWAQREDVRERFVEEARILRRADSDHVVRVYDIGEVDSTPYFVMTYADRGTLADLVADGSPLPLGRAVDLVAQAGAGVSVLHRHGVLHRDIKPQNLLLTSAPDGADQVLVADLGVAKAMLQASGLTQVVGTPAYMAPEQAQGEPLDARTDVHALGAVAYQLLTGRLLREGGISSLLQPTDPVPPSRLADLPAAVDAVVLRAVAVDPARRFPDVDSFVAALRTAAGVHPAAVGGADAAPAPGAPSRPRPRRLRTALLALLVLALTSVAAFAAVRALDGGRDATAASNGSGGPGGSGGSASSTPLGPPAADIDFPPLTIDSEITYQPHLVRAGANTWTYGVPQGWVAYAVSDDSGDAGPLTDEEADGRSQVRWRPPGEPLVGGHSLRVEALSGPDGAAPDTPLADVVAAKAKALEDSRDLVDVDVFRQTSDAVYFTYRDGNDRLRYNYFRWVANDADDAALEISVSGRKVDEVGLDNLLEAVVGVAQPGDRRGPQAGE